MLKSKGAEEDSFKGTSFDLLEDLGGSAGGGGLGTPTACVMGCRVPLGSRKQGASGLGRPDPGSKPGRTLALRKSEYGTMMIGFVGSARKGCWGGMEAAGEGGVLQVVVSMGDAGVDPEVQLEAAFELVGTVEVVGLTGGLTMCLELQ